MPLGLAISSRCAPDQASALLAFNADFPQYSNNEVISVLSSSFVDVQKIGFWLHSLTISDGKIRDVYGEIVLQSCDLSNDPNYFLQPIPADIFYVFTWGMGAVLLMFFFGFVISVAVSAIRKL